jgi:hypothetical protein
MPKSILSGTFTAIESSAAVDISNYQRKDFMLLGDGNDDAGTVQVELAVDDPPTLWAPLYTDEDNLVGLTTGGAIHFTAIGRWLRVSLVGGGGAPNLDYEVFH